jgi:methionyl-tRNA formyltransferase
MRIVFAGTPAFAVPALSSLLEGSHEVVGVYTQPDRPAGRGLKPSPSPIKQLSQSYGIQVYQPRTLKDAGELDRLRALQADLMVVVAYGLILPASVLALHPRGCVNVHASLLPRWRGAAPIQRALLAGDGETGVTIMFIESRLDAGPMLLKKRCPIEDDIYAGELHDRLARLGAEALMEALPMLETGMATPEIQDEALACYAPKIDKGEAVLDWAKSAAELCRQVRAFNPWPVSETVYAGRVLRVWRAQALAEPVDQLPGTVMLRDNSVDVAAGAGVLRLLEVQLPGGRRVSALDFRNANPLQNQRLG